MNKQETIEPFITIPELANRKTLSLGETKLYELAKRGQISSYRVGKKILVKESEVHADIARHFGMKVIHGNSTKR